MALTTTENLNKKPKIRKARKEDMPVVLELIKELANYEKAPQEATITLEDLENDGFSNNPAFECLLLQLDDGYIAGMAFYFRSYSTWKGACLYLEDIIIREHLRGKGYGKLLFEAVMLVAKKMGARRMQWQVLDWNEPAINFYKKYNAILDPTWINGKFTFEQLQKFNSNIVDLESINS